MWFDFFERQMRPNMIQTRLVKYLAAVLVISYSLTAEANDQACNAGLKLQDYGPNTISYRKDENDVANIDFVMTQMFPMFHDGCPVKKPDLWGSPYLSFSGQLGFYAFDGRASRPVIGKRFNPKFFVRHWLDSDNEYFDMGYAHESNGQSINSEAAYQQKINEMLSRSERADFANDYLSRGWDYLDLNYKVMVLEGELLGKNTLYVNLKYFLRDGLFQGAPEEFYSWETTDGKYRKEVDGVTLLFKTSNISDARQNGYKVAFQFTTGYENIFKYSTARLEFSYKMKDWPAIMLWGAKGYNTDLIDYYKNISSYGIGLEFRNFVNDY